MKKQKLPVLAVLTLVFAAFTFGFFLGRGSGHGGVTLDVPPAMQTAPAQSGTETETAPSTPAILFPIDLNTAGREELMALPGIGEVLAGRILRYRDAHGAFTAVEDLMKVEGIGEARLETILDKITIGG